MEFEGDEHTEHNQSMKQVNNKMDFDAFMALETHLGGTFSVVYLKWIWLLH